MTDNVIRLVPSAKTDEPLDANAILAGARLAKLDAVIVMGFRQEGGLYVAHNMDDQNAVYTIEAGKLSFFLE